MALLAAAIVVIVALMNGDALERVFTPSSRMDAPPTPAAGSGDGGRQEMR